MPDPVRRARVATSAVFLLSGAVLGIWATEVPLIKARLALSNATLGAALLCLALGAFAAMPLAGPLAARFGAGWAIRVGVLFSCPALPAAVLAPNLPSLCVALGAFGIGVGTIDVAMNAHAVEVEHALGRPVLSSLHAMWSLGGLAGSAGGGVLLALLSPGWQTGAAAALAGMVLLVAPGAMLPPQPRHAVGGRAAWRLWADPGLLLVGLLMCGSFMVEGAMLDWSGVYLLGARGMPPAFAALGYSAFSAAMMAMRFAGDRVRGRLGSGGALRMAGLGVAGLGVALAAPGGWTAVAGFALVGVGVANVVPVLFALAGWRGRAGGSPSAAVGVAASIGYAGVLGGPPLLGLVAQASSVAGALWLVAGLCGAIAALGGWVGGTAEAAPRTRSG